MKVQVSGWSESLNLKPKQSDADLLLAFILEAAKTPGMVKYVVYDDHFPVIICGAISHNDITVKGKKPTSAAFFDITEDGDGVPR